MDNEYEFRTKPDTHIGRHDNRGGICSRSVSWKSDHSRTSCKRKDHYGHTAARTQTRSTIQHHQNEDMTEIGVTPTINKGHRSDRTALPERFAGAVLTYANPVPDKRTVEEIVGAVFKENNIRKACYVEYPESIECRGWIDTTIWREIFKRLPTATSLFTELGNGSAFRLTR